MVVTFPAPAETAVKEVPCECALVNVPAAAIGVRAGVGPLAGIMVGPTVTNLGRGLPVLGNKAR